MLGSRACKILKIDIMLTSFISSPPLPLEKVLVPADELKLLLPAPRVVLVNIDQPLGHPQVLGQNFEQLPHGKVNQVKTGQEAEETLPGKYRISCFNDGCFAACSHHYSQLFRSFATGFQILLYSTCIKWINWMCCKWLQFIKLIGLI